MESSSNFPVTSLLDLAVFIEASEETRFTRRIPRDVEERGRTAERHGPSSKRRCSLCMQYVAPSVGQADLVIDGEQNPQLSTDYFCLVSGKLIRFFNPVFFYLFSS